MLAEITERVAGRRHNTAITHDRRMDESGNKKRELGCCYPTILNAMGRSSRAPDGFTRPLRHHLLHGLLDSGLLDRRLGHRCDRSILGQKKSPEPPGQPDRSKELIVVDTDSQSMGINRAGT